MGACGAAPPLESAVPLAGAVKVVVVDAASVPPASGKSPIVMPEMAPGARIGDAPPAPAENCASGGAAHAGAGRRAPAMSAAIAGVASLRPGLRCFAEGGVPWV